MKDIIFPTALKVDSEEKISVMTWYIYKAVLSFSHTYFVFLHVNMYYAAFMISNIILAGKRECLGWYRLYVLAILCILN